MKRPFTLIAVTSAAAGVAFFGATKAKDVEQAEVSSPAPQSASVEHPETAPPPAATGVHEVDEGRDESPKPVPAPSTTQVPANSVQRGPLPVDVGETLACIRRIESGGDYSTDTGNGYYGAYQFDASTWASVGGEGNPAEASPEEQDARAARLLSERGLQPWPPARGCG